MVEVLKFISLIRESYPELQVKIFTEGACYSFYEILKTKYPKAIPYYDGSHVITKIGKKFYDITGEVFPNEHHSVMEAAPEDWGREYLDREKDDE